MAERGEVAAQQPLEHDLAARLADRQAGRLAQRRDRGRVVVDPLELERDRAGVRRRGREARSPVTASTARQNAIVSPTDESPSARSTKNVARVGIEPGQPPLDPAVLVPVEQVQVEHLLAGRDQAHVERLPAGDADRSERELERLAADHVRLVVAGEPLALAPPRRGNASARWGGTSTRLSRLPLSGRMPYCS